MEYMRPSNSAAPKYAHTARNKTAVRERIKREETPTLCIKVQTQRFWRNDCGNSVFVNKLLFTVGIQYNGKAVKAFYYAVKLETVHEEHSHGGLVVSDLIEEDILEILRFLHFSQLLFLEAALQGRSVIK